MSHLNIISQLGSNPYGLENLQNYYDFETGENIEDGLNCGVINANICAFKFFEIDINGKITECCERKITVEEKQNSYRQKRNANYYIVTLTETIKFGITRKRNTAGLFLHVWKPFMVPTRKPSVRILKN